MKYLKIEDDAVFSALAALSGAYHDEKVRAECGQSWPERVEYFKSNYDRFEAAVIDAVTTTAKEEEDETV